MAGGFVDRITSMESLARCAYAIYIVHYPFVLWARRLVLTMPIQAALKFAITFVAALLLSWLTAQVVLPVPELCPKM